MRTTEERWFYHAYDYGWRRVVLFDSSDQSHIDPDKLWFDARLAAQAEAMWRKHFRRPAPLRQAPPSSAEVAAVTALASKARANVRDWAAHGRTAMRGPKENTIADAQASLGLSSKPQPAFVSSAVPDTMYGKPRAPESAE